MQRALLFIVILFITACDAVQDMELEKAIAAKTNAKSCKISSREDINKNKPKTLLVEITEPNLNSYDLDLQRVTSRIATYIVDSTKDNTYKEYKSISVKYYLAKDSSEYGVSIAEVKNAKPFIAKATRFVKAFAGLDTATADQLINYRFIEQDEMEFSMETPYLQRDTFGAVSSVNLLGFANSNIQRNSEDVYEVAFAVLRKNKITETYQVLIDRRDTLVVGYSWQLQNKK